MAKTTKKTATVSAKSNALTAMFEAARAACLADDAAKLTAHKASILFARFRAQYPSAEDVSAFDAEMRAGYVAARNDCDHASAVKALTDTKSDIYNAAKMFAYRVRGGAKIATELLKAQPAKSDDQLALAVAETVNAKRREKKGPAAKPRSSAAVKAANEAQAQAQAARDDVYLSSAKVAIPILKSRSQLFQQVDALCAIAFRLESAAITAKVIDDTKSRAFIKLCEAARAYKAFK